MIGKGGINDAEGATTLIVDGASSELQKIWDLVMSIKGAKVSGTVDSLIDCVSNDTTCENHKGCVYKVIRTKKRKGLFDPDKY